MTSDINGSREKSMWTPKVQGNLDNPLPMRPLKSIIEAIHILKSVNVWNNILHSKCSFRSWIPSEDTFSTHSLQSEAISPSISVMLVELQRQVDHSESGMYTGSVTNVVFRYAKYNYEPMNRLNCWSSCGGILSYFLKDVGISLEVRPRF